MEGYIIFGTFILIPIFFYLFYRLTTKTTVVTVKKKYRVNENRFIIDHRGIKYKITPCFWKIDYDYRKIWRKLEEGHKYQIEYYGIDAPDMMSYYKIIDIKN